MAPRVPFVNTADGAYHHREQPKEDEELTRVGPGTPCGEYLRRFWHPICGTCSGGVFVRSKMALTPRTVAVRTERSSQPTPTTGSC